MAKSRGYHREVVRLMVDHAEQQGEFAKVPAVKGQTVRLKSNVAALGILLNLEQRFGVQTGRR